MKHNKLINEEVNQFPKFLSFTSIPIKLTVIDTKYGEVKGQLFNGGLHDGVNNLKFSLTSLLVIEFS